MKVRKLLLILIFLIIFLLVVKAQNQNLRGNKFIETLIISGPGLIIENNEVKFEFKGIDYTNKSKYFYFQTKLWPIDKSWQNIYNNQVRYLLPKGRQFYILRVRAVNDKGEYDLSPAVYYFLINISSFYGDIFISPSSDGFSLKLTNYSDKKIKITGWRIRTSFIDFVIPQAVKDFHPYRKVNQFEDIVLVPNGSLTIKAVYSNSNSAPRELDYRQIPLSPLGVNFLGNKCFIYLNKDYYNLNYPTYYCDSLNLSQEDILNLVLQHKISWRCATKLSLVGCSGVESYLINQFNDDPACLSFISNWFNYDSCYQRNRLKDDFFEKEWFVFFDNRDDFEKLERKPLKRLFRERYERIYLYDANGLLVNFYNLY